MYLKKELDIGHPKSLRPWKYKSRRSIQTKHIDNIDRQLQVSTSPSTATPTNTYNIQVVCCFSSNPVSSQSPSPSARWQGRPTSPLPAQLPRSSSRWKIHLATRQHGSTGASKRTRCGFVVSNSSSSSQSKSCHMFKKSDDPKWTWSQHVTIADLRWEVGVLPYWQYTQIRLIGHCSWFSLSW